jgi:hypothetical protein
MRRFLRVRRAGVSVTQCIRVLSRSKPERRILEGVAVRYEETTPNGHNFTMFVEKAGIPYRSVPVNFSVGGQFRVFQGTPNRLHLPTPFRNQLSAVSSKQRA